jgi:hypothetical protein
MTVYVADAHALIQRLVSVVRMASVLVEHTTEEQSSVHFCGQKLSTQKKCFLFTVGSVPRKAVHNWMANVSLMAKRLKRRCGNSQDNSQTTSFYAAGFNAPVTRRDKCMNVGGGYVEEEIFFFLQERISLSYVFLRTSACSSLSEHCVNVRHQHYCFIA